VHDHPPHRHLDRDARTVQLVRTPPLDLHGGGRRDGEVDLPAKARERGLQVALGGRVALFDHVALGIARRREL
jgi:hypothetical protein